MARPGRCRMSMAGPRRSGDGSTTARVFKPATGEQTGLLYLATAAEVGEAVAAATKAFPAWSGTTPLRRARILNRFLHIMEERIGELAAVITAEDGKTLSDTTGGIVRGMRDLEVANS